MRDIKLTPLGYDAICKDSSDIIEIVQSTSANVNEIDDYGYTAIFYTVLCNRIDNLWTLAYLGADVNAKITYGKPNSLFDIQDESGLSTPVCEDCCTNLLGMSAVGSEADGG